MKRYRFAAPIVLLMLVTTTVFADFNYSTDYLNERTVIKGTTASAGEFVTVRVYCPNKDENSSVENALLFNDQCVAENGMYEIPFSYSGAENGLYEVSVRESGTDKIYTKKIRLVPKAEYTESVSKLNAAAQKSPEDFKNEFEIYGNVFDTDENLKNGASFGEAIKEFGESVKAKPLKDNDNRLNDKRLNSYVVLKAVKSGDIKNVVGLIDYLQLNEKFTLDLTKVCKSDAASEYFTARLANTASLIPEEPEKAWYEALILTTARYGNDGELRNVTEKYGAETGMQLSAINGSAYAKAIGHDYGSISELNEALKNPKDGEGPTTPGNRPSAPGNSGNSGKSGIITSGTGSNKLPEIKARFIDLNTVDWAYEAIMSLADKGIINGKTENEFYPDWRITREEFVKLLVCSAGLENRQYTDGHFSDVNKNEWYSKYVNIAYENNICKGNGDGTFGAGSEITRQDMAVMIYNFLKADGESIGSADAFADDADISDYARTAVYTLAESRIINGMNDNKFAPKENATRAQTAVIIYRAYERISGVTER